MGTGLTHNLPVSAELVYLKVIRLKICFDAVFRFSDGWDVSSRRTKIPLCGFEKFEFPAFNYMPLAATTVHCAVTEKAVVKHLIHFSLEWFFKKCSRSKIASDYLP